MIERPPLKNNLPLAAFLFVVLASTAIGLSVLARKDPSIGTDFAASVLLFALSVVNLTLLLVVLFVLVRNLVRAFLDSRRGVVGARLRLRLVLALLVMGLLPSLILIGVGGSLLLDSSSRWLSFDAAGMAGAAQAVALRVEEERVRSVRALASSAASELGRRRLKEPTAPPASMGLALPNDTDLLIILNARDESEAIYGRSPLLTSEIAPEAFLRRGLARVLYEEQGYRQALSGAPFVVDCQLVRLEEVEENGAVRKVVVGIVVTIHDERRVLVGDTFVAEEATADAEDATIVRAYGKALRRALDHVADDLPKASRAQATASAPR